MQGSLWIIPAFVTLFLYGIGQGLVKKWSEDVPPAKFCLYLILARAVVNLGYFFTQEHPPPFTEEGLWFMLTVIFAYVLDGLGWVLYFESIVLGPITIVGTLSAAYPALTLLFARVFLDERLISLQYFGVFMVIFGCLGLSYSPPDAESKVTNRRWIPLAISALICWGAAQTLVKYAYGLPAASEANMSLFATFGGLMTLGVILASATGPASLVAPITGAYPVVTLIFAAFLLKEHISRLQWTCLVILLAGIGFSTIPQAPEEPEAPQAAKLQQVQPLAPPG